MRALVLEKFLLASQLVPPKVVILLVFAAETIHPVVEPVAKDQVHRSPHHLLHRHLPLHYPVNSHLQTPCLAKALRRRPNLTSIRSFLYILNYGVRQICSMDIVLPWEQSTVTAIALACLKPQVIVRSSNCLYAYERQLRHYRDHHLIFLVHGVH